ncbi:MAG: c-type cytochrome [Candidatus Tectomicrobia bacterium]|uniref:C-type cytochrome n=1 Tax=Tectimicrobiota bacterium TaxID=2528274 RepID=A0A933LQK2_UNCTE|nr:c-type cytochrome [Candidatus Tectomicrobia bacterium]
MKKSIILIAMVLLVGLGKEQETFGGNNPADLSRGQDSFKKNCVVCHGEKGLGDGLAAKFLFPKPRNFTDVMFKIRSTSSGDVPTDQDLFNTIKNGMPGSAMPSFSYLPEEERWKLVEFIKTLGVKKAGNKEINLWKIRKKPHEIEVPPQPELTGELLARGKQLYFDKNMACRDCHGEKGRGDGPKATSFKDDWGYPIIPNDFTRGIYKGGGTVSDLYLRFTTGMAGTPMPSFEESLPSHEDRWALSYYVKSLAGEKVARQLSQEKIVAKKVNKEIPLNPQDKIWTNTKVFEIPLMLLWQRQKVAEAISVRALQNGKNIAILLEWEDAVVNSRFIRPEDFTDAVALQFALTELQGHFSMGSKEEPVNIWQWRLDREMDLEKFHDVEDAHRGMVRDDYQFAHPDYPKSVEKEGHIPITPAQFHDKTYLTGWGAGNQFSNPKRPSAVEELNAEGFGTLEIQAPDDQGVAGRGVWNNGKWQVMFVRSLKTTSEKDVQFGAGKQISLAFAVWDGERRDRDGQKAVSYWQILEIEK